MTAPCRSTATTASWTRSKMLTARLVWSKGSRSLVGWLAGDGTGLTRMSSRKPRRQVSEAYHTGTPREPRMFPRYCVLKRGPRTTTFTRDRCRFSLYLSTSPRISHKRPDFPAAFLSRPPAPWLWAEDCLFPTNRNGETYGLSSLCIIGAVRYRQCDPRHALPRYRPKCGFSPWCAMRGCRGNGGWRGCCGAASSSPC